MDKPDELRKQLLFFFNENMERLICSNPRNREGFIKMSVRPVLLKETLKFQIEESTEQQVFHRNMECEEAVSYIMKQMEEQYRNAELFSRLGSLNVLISKKETMTLKVKKKVRSDEPSNSSVNLLSHNRKKCYVLEEGTPIPFLVDLGVMSAEGMVVKAKYDKFRQINRFLEYIEDILPRLDRNQETVILDFGCGKSYLTFAMYYYLKEVKGYPIKILGLDLKKDVITLCNRLSEKFGFDNLCFYHGDIAEYEGVSHVDMVVTLHACDTATDYAIAKAIRWGAKVILSVPCCQHEINGQIENELLKPVLQYGLIKERMAALLTDGIRAGLLEEAGYQTHILEFIDMEHTPKNIMIRAVKRKSTKKPEQREALKHMIEELHTDPTLYRLLKEQGVILW